MNTLVKGQVIMVELNSTEANVQRGLRPVVVIQNNIGNKFSPTLIVAPLTSRIKRDMVTHAKLYPTIENGLSVASTALLEQIQTISKDSVKRVLGVLNDVEMKLINKAIIASLAL